MSIICGTRTFPPMCQFEAPASMAGARLTYVNDGRAGRVIFSLGGQQFDMYFEFGGGDALAVVDVPRAREWQRRTGFPLSMRAPILEFVGRTIVRDQTSSGTGTFVIHENAITIYASSGER